MVRRSTPTALEKVGYSMRSLPKAGKALSAFALIDLRFQR